MYSTTGQESSGFCRFYLHVTGYTVRSMVGLSACQIVECDEPSPAIWR